MQLSRFSSPKNRFIRLLDFETPKVATVLSFRIAPNCAVRMEFDETLGEGRRRVGLHLLNCQSKLFRFWLVYRVAPVVVFAAIFHYPKKNKVLAKGPIVALGEDYRYKSKNIITDKWRQKKYMDAQTYLLSKYASNGIVTTATLFMLLSRS